MKKSRIRALLITAVCLVATALSVLTVQAREEWEKIGYAQVTTNTILHTKANTQTVASYKRVVPKGGLVHVISYSGNDWYKVQYGSRTGFIMGAFLTDEDDEDLSDDIVTKITAVNLTMRSSPMVLTTNQLGVIPAGRTVTILGERKDNWISVSYGGKEGYVKNGFFRTDFKSGKGYSWKYAAQALFIRSAPTVSEATYVATLKPGARVKVIGVSGNWYKVRYKSKIRYVKEGYFTTEILKNKYATEVISTAINFRKARAFDKSNIIRVLKAGTSVQVVKSLSKQWYKIMVGTKTGYIIGGYFLSDRESGENESSSTEKRITTAALRMRSGRGTDYDIITVIPKSTVVTLQAKFGDWYKVKYVTDEETYSGWVSGAYLDEVPST